MPNYPAMSGLLSHKSAKDRKNGGNNPPNHEADPTITLPDLLACPI
jgi:hypothetical protein